MTKKQETILIQQGEEIIELKGAELEAFKADRAKFIAEQEALKAKEQAQKELKISAYKKLGLTDDEIAAIL